MSTATPPNSNNNLVTRSDLIALFSEILDYRERARISSRLGKICALVDPEESYYHIEPSTESSKEWCILWRIADWRTHYENWKRQKEQDGLERWVNVHFSDVRERVLRRLRSSPIFSMLEPDAQETLAFKLCVSRDPAQMALFAPGIKLDDLLSADNALKEFKNKNSK